MASNLCRLFSSSALKLTFSHTRSDQLTRSLSNSVNRLICSATQQPHPLEENPKQSHKQRLRKRISKTKARKKIKKTTNDYDDNGNFVNKATGEVGGPRGPEPTRFGDWEKNGRCCDF
ncbi:uncharacterized protein LOC132182768 [Corylus avellana]|uniref:uncharacterized protein LOC132182768 n=1 Tax=Corylus avellana TaxID=13451 RepID=UPI00286C76B4|nr:uncharacterized protein LOC132182768 [Corylus avellana]